MKFRMGLCGMVASVVSMAALFAGNAHAITIDCGVTPSTYVDGAVACEKSTSATQDFLNTDPMTVNAEAFFDITDWLFAGKTNQAGDIDIGFGGDGTGGAGDWEIDPTAWSGWDDIMLVFKSGNGTTLVGFLLDGATTEGDWISPFTNALFSGLKEDQIKDVSHISAYVSGPRYTVPEPGSVVLLATGLLFLGWRLKRAAQL